MSDCVFCKIASKEIPARLAAEGDGWVAFHDISPKAPVHVLVIPRRHVARLADTSEADAALLGTLAAAAVKIGRDLCPRGFRVVVNDGAEAGQSVWHLHAHVLGGRPMAWPPG